MQKELLIKDSRGREIIKSPQQTNLFIKPHFFIDRIDEGGGKGVPIIYTLKPGAKLKTNLNLLNLTIYTNVGHRRISKYLSSAQRRQLKISDTIMKNKIYWIGVKDLRLPSQYSMSTCPRNHFLQFDMANKKVRLIGPKSYGGWYDGGGKLDFKKFQVKREQKQVRMRKAILKNYDRLYLKYIEMYGIEKAKEKYNENLESLNEKFNDWKFIDNIIVAKRKVPPKGYLKEKLKASKF